MVFEDSFLMTELFKIARNIHLIDDGCYAYMYNSHGTMGGGLTIKKANDALFSHLFTLESCKFANIDKVKYGRLWDVIAYDTYCAASYFGNNIFPEENLKRLWKCKPNQADGIYRSAKILSISKILGFANFIKLSSFLRKIFRP